MNTYANSYCSTPDRIINPQYYTNSAILQRIRESRDMRKNSNPSGNEHLIEIYKNHADTLTFLNSPRCKRLSEISDSDINTICRFYTEGVQVVNLAGIYELCEKEIQILLSIHCDNYQQIADSRKGKTVKA